MIDAKIKKRVLEAINWIIIVLSILLITFISIDTFNNIDFLENPRYMGFQLWVCIIFLLAFIIELAMSDGDSSKCHIKL